MTSPRGDVVVVLPWIGNKVLMQLRDIRPDIVHPGGWGFFGGSVEPGEAPIDAARREIAEEIEFTPSVLLPLSTDRIPELDHLVSHAFSCSLTLPLEKLVLREGRDFGLYSQEEIASGALYSRMLNAMFPVIPVSYIPDTVKKLMERRLKC